MSSALFFKYNTQLGPPYQVLVDTNFINFSIKNKVSSRRGEALEASPQCAHAHHDAGQTCLHARACQSARHGSGAAWCMLWTHQGKRSASTPRHPPPPHTHIAVGPQRVHVQRRGVPHHALRAPAPMQIDLVRGMMDCLYAECKPCITDCVLAELEKLGQKYRIALKVAKVRLRLRLALCPGQ